MNYLSIYQHNLFKTIVRNLKTMRMANKGGESFGETPEKHFESWTCKNQEIALSFIIARGIAGQEDIRPFEWRL